MIAIDGSVLEGGGQIVRMALACSALTGKSISITKIRAGRQKGGLAAQHLKGLQLMKQICQAEVQGAALGSTEITFKPNGLFGGKYYADTQTAGSVALLWQVAYPATIFCDTPVTLELRGGTNAEMAPQIDFLSEILRPNLEKFGITFDLDLRKRGYFPKGGGCCIIDIKPIKSLNPIELIDMGEIDRFFGWSFVAGTLPIKMAHEFCNGAKSNLKSIGLNKPIDIEVYKENSDIAVGNCSGIILGCQTKTGCTIGGSSLGSRKESCYESGKRAAKEIIDTIESKSCVDEHVQDQLIIFMAMAKGISRIKCANPLTLHTQTAIYIAELITQVKFNITTVGSNCIIECNGIGLENKFL